MTYLRSQYGQGPTVVILSSGVGVSTKGQIDIIEIIAMVVDWLKSNIEHFVKTSDNWDIKTQISNNVHSFYHV